MKKIIIMPLLATVLGLSFAACSKVEVDTEWKPLPDPEPSMHCYGVDMEFDGDTALFSRNVTLYFAPGNESDKVGIAGLDGDTMRLEGGVLTIRDCDGLHLHTTPNVSLFEGILSMVIRDMPDPPANMRVSVALSRDDSIYAASQFHVATSDTSLTLRMDGKGITVY